MPGTPTPRLNTVGRIAEKLREPVHRISYVLATRPHIRPSAFAGRARLFDRRGIAQIRHELNAMDARQDVSPPPHPDPDHRPDRPNPGCEVSGE